MKKYWIKNVTTFGLVFVLTTVGLAPFIAMPSVVKNDLINSNIYSIWTSDVDDTDKISYLSTSRNNWPPDHYDVEFLPRVNIVHLSETDIDTQYNFLASIPMTIFHYDNKVYNSLLISDKINDIPTQYIVDDWATYLNNFNGALHINFIGDVSSSIKNTILNKYGINWFNVTNITGTPIDIANEIAKHDWLYSDYIVIAPYLSSLTNEDIESISNGASLAALYNAPLLFTDPSSISSETLNTINSLGATKIVLVEIGDSIQASVNTQLQSAGLTVAADLTSESSIVTHIRSLSGKSTLCGIFKDWQNIPAAIAAARYGGYILYLPDSLPLMTTSTHNQLTEADNAYYKLTTPTRLPPGYIYGEEQIAQAFYNWLNTLNGNDPNALETVITFNTAPYYDPINGVDVDFERAISGDPSDLSNPGAVPGRMPLDYIGNIALINRDGMYRATIFSNPRPKHVTLVMNAYEVWHNVDAGTYDPDNWGNNHIINEIFGWPYRGWCTANSYFPWQDIQNNPPGLSPILPPGSGDGPDCDPGQFASFNEYYETHFHSGAYPGAGSHPSQPTVSNIGFVNDIISGSAFIYFSCHGGGTVISVRDIDNGVAQDSADQVPWNGAYWPSTDERVYDGSDGGHYTQTNLDQDIDNVHNSITGYNACDMANGKMNEVLLIHGGAASIGSYTSVSFTGSGWWWNLFVHLVTHEHYTIGEAATYATARVAELYTPGSPTQPNADSSLQYVLYGDPNIHFIQGDWISPEPAPLFYDYSGHFPDAPPSDPPYTPEKPEGPTFGKIGLEYTFSSRTTDPDGDQISYQFDWDDGNFSSWIGPVDSGVPGNASHIWTVGGDYEIRCRAKDKWGFKSNWSEPLPLRIAKPEIEISSINGGIGKIMVDIQNTGDANATDIPWTVDLKRRIYDYPAKYNKHFEGTIDILNAGKLTTIPCGLIYGLGLVVINVKAYLTEKKVTGLIIGPLIFIEKNRDILIF